MSLPAEFVSVASVCLLNGTSSTSVGTISINQSNQIMRFRTFNCILLTSKSVEKSIITQCVELALCRPKLSECPTRSFVKQVYT